MKFNIFASNFSCRSGLWFPLPIIACLSIVLGTKILLIATHGGLTPFWDQWDSEAAFLFKPYVTGTLDPWTLVAGHNEHRILWSRLIALALLILANQWDPILEMLVNALISVSGIGVLLVFVSRRLDALAKPILAVFAALLFSIPFGYENTLWGFQSPFYLLILFGILSLGLLCESRAWSPRWWVGTLVAVAGYFTLASSTFTLAAFMAVVVIQLAIGLRAGMREWLAFLFHGAILGIMLHYIPGNPSHDVLKAHSAEQLLTAFLTAASWPVAATHSSDLNRALAAALINAPVMLLAARMLIVRPSLRDPLWLYLGVAGWVALQMIAIAHGRAASILASRYFDIFILHAVLNFACLLYLLRVVPAKSRPQAMVICATFVWTFVVLGGTRTATETLSTEIAQLRSRSETQTQNVKGYLATGDVNYINKRPLLEIPYPSSDRLRALLSDTDTRSFLPTALFDRVERARFKNGMLRYGHLLIPLGLALFFFIAIAAYVGATRKEFEPP